ncbi:MlaC/ttg2D family ABC transporter substrate-binding protein [Desertibaculum subflavum]|uniref:MlaC/ttg2D family ABC transporter substrate-binding protein n=1 Tax=Desertibaculum subflavum TaxID=2268458 RepID=UPI0013C44018
MHRRDVMLAAGGLILAVAAGMPAFALEQAAARDFVTRLAGKTLAVLRAESNVDARASKLAPLLRDGLDLGAMGKFVLGRQGRELTPTQQKSFGEAFEKHVVETYSDLLARQSVADVKITGDSKQPDGDVLVNSEITRGGAPPTPYDWRVRETTGGLKVVDVVINGVSLLITRRQEFASVMRKDGVDGLIRRLESGQGA